MSLRSLVSAGLIASFLIGGCSSYHPVPRQQLDGPATLEDVRVATIDGFEYRFDAVTLAPDSLIGTYRVVEERVKPGQEVWYEDAVRRHAIPRSKVVRVELIRKDPVKTALYGASFAAAGFLLVTFVQEGIHEPSNNGGGGGKGPIKP